ncbi:membrane-associated phospholipid phosphatase [Sphingomonas jejuensis]|uniref:Membrane-associated phospholipid phosphatase n=1 Tax=Sphingomonas jejuensis TaxID=904715 RepID=A0ABX0XQX1_9SPHN|nr:phosphatase PAP2 family protein [Sphingomonas jejuensis]NJC35242.1 membrane-associated phospholipid phosphatase [Sphingomonas jejuensis]
MGKGKKAAKRARKGLRQVEQVDVAVTHAAAAHRRAPAVRALGIIGDLADQPPMLALSGGVAVAAWLLGDRGLARTSARMAASIVLATAGKTLVKRLVDRTRPHLLVDHDLYELDEGTGTDDGDYNSFPSGHTADAVAAARAVSRGHPGAAPAAAALALVAAAIQIPRCRHYLSDVGAGALVGWSAEAAGSGLVDRLWPEEPNAPVAALPAPGQGAG